jgi:DNA polymerase I-like protein with 3'-5' exonuclease and polymerase domains
VAELKGNVETHIRELEAWAFEKGLMRPKSKKDLSLSVNKTALGELVLKAYQGNPPHTDGGGISTSRETLEDSGDPVLERFVEVNRWRKFQTYLPTLEEATTKPLNVKPNILLSTGRVSYEGLIQLMPRTGGVRECFVARAGCVWSSVDYAAIEMSTLAQVCLWALGYSTLADAINASKDVHSLLGANLMGITYEAFVEKKKEYKNVRQGAKIGNFGYPGMMGEAKFVTAQKKQATKVCELFFADGKCGETRVMEWHDKPLDSPLCKRCLEQSAKIRSGFVSVLRTSVENSSPPRSPTKVPIIE